MSYQIALASFRSLPTVFAGVHAALPDAVAAADAMWRDSLRSILDDGAIPPRYQNSPRSDMYVIPADLDHPGLRSAEVRSGAVYSLAGRDWHDAFTPEENAAWQDARERMFD